MQVFRVIIMVYGHLGLALQFCYKSLNCVFTINKDTQMFQCSFWIQCTLVFFKMSYSSVIIELTTSG